MPKLGAYKAQGQPTTGGTHERPPHPPSDPSPDLPRGRLVKRDLSYLRELLVQFEDGVWKPEVNGIGKDHVRMETVQL